MGSNVYASEQERLAGKPTLAEEIFKAWGIDPSNSDLTARDTVEKVLKTLGELGYEIKKKESATPPAATATTTTEN